MPERARKTAVVGVGNILMGDEGVGVRVIEALEGQSLPAGTQLFDGGTAFQALTGQLVDFQKLIIVDAVNGDELPGTIYRFQLADIADELYPLEGKEHGGLDQGGAISLHDIGVLEALMMERLAERASPRLAAGARGSKKTLNRSGLSHAEIVLIGIEPERIEPSMKLSSTVEHRLPALVQTVLQELDRDRICGRAFADPIPPRSLVEEEPS